MHKNTKNIGFTGTGLFSFIGAFGEKILNALGYADIAMNFDEYSAIFNNPKISWEALYLYIFILCIVALIFNNWKFIKGVKPEKIKPDRSTEEAIEYIVKNSNYGRTLSYDQTGFVMAAEALKGEMKRKSIKIWAVSKNSYKPIRIRHFISIEYKLKKDNSTVIIGHGYSTKWSGTDIKGKYFTNIMVSNKQLKKVFPHKGGFHNEHA